MSPMATYSTVPRGRIRFDSMKPKWHFDVDLRWNWVACTRSGLERPLFQRFYGQFVESATQRPCYSYFDVTDAVDVGPNGLPRYNFVQSKPTSWPPISAICFTGQHENRHHTNHYCSSSHLK